MVCTGNLCRSPMAAALLRHEVAQRGCDGIDVVSAGTWAGDGYSPTGEAISVLDAKGIDLSSHRSQAVNERLIADADLIVAMTSVHIREILELVPDAAEKIVLLKEVREIKVVDPGPGADKSERLRALLSGVRPDYRRAYDVDDPIGLGMPAYHRCVRELDEGVTALVDLLCSGDDRQSSAR